MKSFIKNSLIFVFIGLLILTLLYIVAVKFDSGGNFKIKQLLSKADSIEAIAVGNSHACALDFEALGINGYRVALGGNDISETEYQVESIVPLLPNLKTVFINISYFSLYVDNTSIPGYYSLFNKIHYKQFLEKYPFAEAYHDTLVYSDYIVIDTEKLDPFQKNKLGPALDVIMGNTSDGLKGRWNYYQTIPSFTWVKGDFINYLESRLSIVVRKDHWKQVFTGLLSGERSNIKGTLNEYHEIDTYGQHTKALYYSFKSKDSLHNLAKNIEVPKYHCQKQIVQQKENNILNLNFERLISIIRQLQSEGIRVVFYTSPVYKSFTDYFDKQTIITTKRKMHILVKEYGVEYYDFSEDTSITTNNEFFYNCDHLNRFGAAEFSKKFLNVLQLSDYRPKLTEKN